MTDLASTDLTYSFSNRNKVFEGRRGYSVRGTISLGNGSLTYPSAGIPILKGKMGLPRFVRSLQVLETNAKGYIFEYDVSAEKLRLFLSGSITPAGNVTATGNVSAPTISLGNFGANVSTQANLVIGVNAVANGASLVGSAALVNVVGVQAPTFTGDAVALTGDAIAAAALAEAGAGSFAPAAMVLEVLAYGY